MEAEPSITKKKRPIRKFLLWSTGIILFILILATIYITRNFNQILTDALMKTFNSSVVSDVYELKFDKLRVNIFAGNIRVFNVVMQPRTKPLHSYPYINSSFRLVTSKLILEEVQIMKLIKQGKLELSRIEINKPDIQVKLGEGINIFLPYKDTTVIKKDTVEDGKKFIKGFSLDKFQLVDASFHIINTGKHREFTVKKLNISLDGLKLDQQTGMDLFAFKKVELNIGELSGWMQKGAFRTLKFQDLKLDVNSLEVRKSIDTLMFSYTDFNTGIRNLNLNTADSIFNLSLKSLDIAYSRKSINLEGIAFKPNLSQAEMVKREKFQKTQFTVAVGSLNLVNVDFDTLIYHRKVFIDSIKIDKADVSIFKDKSKPLDRKKFPQYLGQKITAIPIPVNIKEITANGVSFVNLERKENGNYARVTIQRGSLEAKNITNLDPESTLKVKLSGLVENKAPVNLSADFSYQKPQFFINCKIGKFNLPDLNKLLAAYTPAKITKGTADEISFSGVVNRTTATGTMKFLYHDLDIDLKVADKKWQNSVVAFAANTYLSANNPVSADQPPKIVHYQATRDLNKGGFNPIIRSFLSGMKETMIMSKENKKTYKEKKKKRKQELEKEEQEKE
jgi:hypothetical protein